MEVVVVLPWVAAHDLAQELGPGQAGNAVLFHIDIFGIVMADGGRKDHRVDGAEEGDLFFQVLPFLADIDTDPVG